MEIETTLEELPKQLENLPFSPKTKIRLLIEDTSSVPQISQWQSLVKRIESYSPLSGCGDMVLNDMKNFRQQSTFKHDVNDL